MSRMSHYYPEDYEEMTEHLDEVMGYEEMEDD